MKKVFVCSPYAGEVVGNTIKAREWCRQEINEGNAPYAPHLIYPELIGEHIPELRDLGIRMGLEYLKVCDEIVICGDRVTPGMAREIEAWRKMGKIFYRVRGGMNINILLKKGVRTDGMQVTKETR